jgi:N-acetylmuramoyl-L-alanine amidase
MARLKYLIIHCTDTPAKMEVTRGMLEEWHMGPCDMDAGRVKYKGKIYSSRKMLPKETINGQPIAKLYGRGWDRLGYSDMILRNGEKINLTPYNHDQVITSDEMTWGAAGYNSVARHIVLVGGKGSLMKFEDHFTEEQDASLYTYIKKALIHHPDIIIIGHNQVAQKNCPGFIVYDWLMDNSLEVYGCKKRKL